MHDKQYYKNRTIKTVAWGSWGAPRLTYATNNIRSAVFARGQQTHIHADHAIQR